MISTVVTIDALTVYHNMAVTLHTTYVVLGFIAIVSSVLVTSLSGSEDGEPLFGLDTKSATHIFSFISTATITLITAFNLGTKSNNCRKAWRLLTYKLAQNRMGHIKDEQLLEAYYEAENILGGVDFNYGHR